MNDLPTDYLTGRLSNLPINPATGRLSDSPTGR